MSDTITCDGRTWRWTGRTWADARSGQIPPLVLARRLDALGASLIAARDAGLQRPSDKLTAACEARVAGQLARAERLVREVLGRQPANPAALAVLCAILRQRGEPEAALAATDPYENSPALLTSRAAALNDMERWDDARRLIERAQTLGALARAGPVRRRLARHQSRRD